MTRAFENAFKLRAYVTPDQFEAVGDGVADDKSALQQAINTGLPVFLAPGKTYGIASRVDVAVANARVFGGGKVQMLSTFDKSSGELCAFNVTALHVSFEDITIDATGLTTATTFNKGIWGAGAAFMSIERCKFINIPKGAGNFQGAIGLNAASVYCRVNSNYFSGCPGSIFFQGAFCQAADNICVNPGDASIALNSINCYGCVVSGNMIANPNQTMIASHIAVEEGANQWVIDGNVTWGYAGIHIGAINVVVMTEARGGVISNNVCNGGASDANPNPVGLISVSGNYNDVIVEGNLVFGCPTGNSASRLLIINSRGSICRNNTIDGESATGIAAVCEIRQGVRGCEVSGNTSRAPAGARHYLVQVGDYGNVPVSFEGLRMYGGSEGINSELNQASITNLKLRIKDIKDNTSSNVLNCATHLGSRMTFMNGGAWNWPHSIGAATKMYGSAAPTTGSYLVGDRIDNIAPGELGTAGSKYVIDGWVCTVAGSPGTWLAQRTLTGN